MNTNRTSVQHRRLSFWQRLDPTHRRRVAKRAWGGILDGNIAEACALYRQQVTT